MLLLPAEMLGMQFNATIEGAGEYRGSRAACYHKVSLLEIPESATLLNDGNRKYRLQGRIRSGALLGVRYDGVVEARVPPLASCRGVVLMPRNEEMQEARSVFMRDGRVFVREDLLGGEYMSFLPHAAEDAGFIFRFSTVGELRDYLLERREVLQEQA